MQRAGILSTPRRLPPRNFAEQLPLDQRWSGIGKAIVLGLPPYTHTSSANFLADLRAGMPPTLPSHRAGMAAERGEREVTRPKSVVNQRSMDTSGNSWGW
ncbi:hypothetical protein [Streptomyces halobius]|uniref:DDE superfamily endonuclease n=1 Tax=Streptomyces halobius TaxID=2879846 RepID=A0ABY4M308_9ACTN|nr:hypothetical protein [Streptomyces halobius]UQA90781.1 hypothetical protein K9S39_01765 [Streptomyces halobius]